MCIATEIFVKMCISALTPSYAVVSSLSDIKTKQGKGVSDLFIGQKLHAGSPLMSSHRVVDGVSFQFNAAALIFVF